MLSRRADGRRRTRWLVLVPALLLAVAAMTVRVLLGTGGGPPGRPRAPAPSASPHCPPADLAGVGGGRAEAAWRDVVEPVHLAACAGDVAALARLLGGGHPTDFATEECGGCSAAQIVAMWRDEYGFAPAALARLLETPPLVDQGGLTYRRGDTVVLFSRGTFQLPSVWSAFFLQCHEDDLCPRTPGG